MLCRTNKSSSWQQEGQGFMCPGGGDRKSTTCATTAAGPSGRRAILTQGHQEQGQTCAEGLVATS